MGHILTIYLICYYYFLTIFNLFETYLISIRVHQLSICLDIYHK